jgi:hypothetical protein
MKYKRFVVWCNDRACDGRWSYVDALICISAVEHINRLPFWKREKVWATCYESTILDSVVVPIECRIKEYEKLGGCRGK